MTPPTARKRLPPRRRAGRPEADGIDRRESLLDAALACFVREGIAATALRSVAREAGLTPAMLHYYFGDKPALLQAVIRERVLPAFESLRAPLAEHLQAADPMPGLMAFVDGVGALVQAHPWLPPLWVREVLCEGGALRELLYEVVGPQLPQLLAARFAQAQREGRLAPGIDPRLLVVSLVGLTLFPAAGAPIWRRMLGAADIDGQAMRTHTLALLQGGAVAAPTPRTRRKR